MPAKAGIHAWSRAMAAMDARLREGDEMAVAPLAGSVRFG